jgi:hypothetical protein
MKRGRKGTYDEEAQVTVHNSDNYSGCMNLLALQKGLLLQAALRFRGHRSLIAKELDISLRNLFRVITAHSLDGVIDDTREAFILLEKMRKEYPLIFMSGEEFDKMFPNKELFLRKANDC